MKALSIQQLALHQIGPVSLTIQANETVALSGPSGVGKSLFLRAIVDLIPHTGNVVFGDVKCSQTPPNVWRKQIGLLPAESFWWSDRVGDHFRTLTSQQVDWFKELGLAESVLDWQVSRCSTGERQRLALLRLLCNEPAVLLLDEPTANLDNETSLQVEALIHHYQTARQSPVLWVTHDQQQARRIGHRQFLITTNGQLDEVTV